MAIIKTNRSVRLNGINPLAYLGQNSYTPPDYVIYQRDPTINDWQDFYVGCIWLNQMDPPTNPPIYKVWMLVSKYNNQAKWIEFATGSGSVVSLSGNIGTNPVFPIAGNIKVFGDGTTINISGDGINTLTASTGSSVAISYPTDSGTAVPSAGVLNVFGGTAGRDTNTTGSGNTIHVELNNAITLGDLSNIAAGNAAVRAQTGDITITANAGVGNFNMPNTVTSGDAGVITFGGTGGGNRWIHNFGSGTTSTFMGNLSGNLTNTGQNNAAYGNVSLLAITSGSGNAALGSGALTDLQSGSSNTGIGHAALNDITTSSFNTTIGGGSGQFILTGHDNCIFGYLAGTNYTGAESNNIIIGSNTGGTLGESNVCRIGAGTGSSQGQLQKTFISGIRGITTGNNDAVAVLVDSANQLGTVSSSRKYKNDIKDMADSSSDILKLRPVTFKYNSDQYNNLQYGLIAEEVDKVFPRLVVYKDGEPESVKYHELPAILLNEIQKLVKRIEELEKKLNTVVCTF